MRGIAPSPNPVVANNGELAHQHWWDDRTRRGNEYLVGKREMVRQGYVTPKMLHTWERMVAKDEKHRQQYERAKSQLWADCPPELNFSQFFTRVLEIDDDKFAPTMIAVFRFLHPNEDRVLTLREMALLMGYPITWKFHQLRVGFAIQGVPVANGRWVADRLLKVVGRR
jgi:site-specific DNA-cytosine methylase